MGPKGPHEESIGSQDWPRKARRGEPKGPKGLHDFLKGRKCVLCIHTRTLKTAILKHCGANGARSASDTK